MDCATEMTAYWNTLAKEAGFNGLKFMCLADNLLLENKNVYNSFDNIIEWQPGAAKYINKNTKYPFINSLKSLRRRVLAKLEQQTGVDFRQWDPANIIKNKQLQFLSYDQVWNDILNIVPASPKNLPGAFVRWDNTPRFHEKGSVIKGDTPEKFGDYMKKQIIHAKETYKSDMLFLFAWNEWAEGGYLEPDEEFGYGYLEALRDALIETDEFV